MDLIVALWSCFALAMFLYGLLKDANNKTWAVLVSSYGRRWASDAQGGYKFQMVFFKSESDAKYDYFGGMKLRSIEGGVEIRPTMSQCLVKPVYLPFGQLVKVGRQRLFLLNRTIYKVAGTDVLIGIRVP